MVVRVLVALMTLVGAVPFRVCTCGATHHQHATDPRPTPGTPGSPEADAPHHDPDCHAVKPRCAMTVGVCVAAPDPPAAVGTGTVAADLPPPTIAPVHAEITSHPPPRGSPLYLTLNVLRN